MDALLLNAGSILGIAMIAFMQAALMLALIYFTVGRLLPVKRRAIGSGIIATMIWFAFWAFAVFQAGLSSMVQPLILLSTCIYFAALCILTRRTHENDKRQALKHQP